METAIDWFKSKYQELYFEADITNMHFKTFEDKFYKLLDNAKEMERQQILIAHTTGYNDCYKYHKGLTNAITPPCANEYYNKNYKQNTNEPN